MKRYLVCLIAPLLMMMLSSFTFSNIPQEHKTNVSDSTVVSVQFLPAQIVVKDNRTMDGITSIIKNNSESNTEVAKSINTVAEAMLSMEQGRRCVSIMDRITTQTGLTINQVNQIIHKKRVWDITFYTLFTIYVLYVLFGMASMTWHATVISMKEWGIKVITGLSSLLLLYLFYLAVDLLLNGAYYPIIKSIINSAPG